MKTFKMFTPMVIAVAVLGAAWYGNYRLINTPELDHFPISKDDRTLSKGHAHLASLPMDKLKPLPKYLEKSIAWLAESQFDNGGWGAGQHSRQDVRDPRAVKMDPATTAFAAMALVRAGNTLEQGPYAENVKRALNFLLETVENAPENSINITDIRGTQPQAKLGQNIDAAMTAQFFARLLPMVEDKAQENRINAALDFCLNRLESSQMEDGSWNTAGWAPVLNSAMANNALELGQKAGREVNKEVLDNSRKYQQTNIALDSDRVSTSSGAGIQLYTLSSTQRATAAEAEEVKKVLRKKKVKAPKPSYETAKDELLDDGYSEEDAERMAYSFVSNQKATAQLQNDAVLSGFGNNGGEEFLSYMMTSESLASQGGQDWDQWHQKMDQRLGKIQNNNGSWSGHHCITSPVFCTAAVIMTLTADRDNHLFSKDKVRG